MFADDVISNKRERSLHETDRMSPELRQCVHEFGYAIVNACLNAKVSDPCRIRQLVREIWDGARQPSQCREKAGTLDWILLQAGAQISAATLLRVLADADLVIVPGHPTSKMIEASMAEVSGFNVRVTKKDKHRLRLKAAVRAGFENLRPKLSTTLSASSRA